MSLPLLANVPEATKLEYRRFFVGPLPGTTIPTVSVSGCLAAALISARVKFIADATVANRQPLITLLGRGGERCEFSTQFSAQATWALTWMFLPAGEERTGIVSFQGALLPSHLVWEPELVQCQILNGVVGDNVVEFGGLVAVWER